mmetsp:Transcript_17724/g.48952  ORF Transcript_17724/g.48952 Transcript_17724/m.48952 type:complete len:121 (-) Transcript_17724:290-652(-)
MVQSPFEQLVLRPWGHERSSQNATPPQLRVQRPLVQLELMPVLHWYLSHEPVAWGNGGGVLLARLPPEHVIVHSPLVQLELMPLGQWRSLHRTVPPQDTWQRPLVQLVLMPVLHCCCAAH